MYMNKVVWWVGFPGNLGVELTKKRVDVEGRVHENLLLHYMSEIFHNGEELLLESAEKRPKP